MKSPRRGTIVTCLALLSACTSVQRESQTLIDQGQFREGLARLEQASRDNPGDVELRMQHLRARDQVVSRLLAEAGTEAASGRLDAAVTLYRQVIAIEPNNARAATGLAAVDAARRHQALAEDARAKIAKGDHASAELMVKSVLLENPGHPLARELERELRERERGQALAPPALRSRLQAPVTLEFREAPLRQVLEALSRSAGINFILDREVRSDLRATVFVRGVRVEDAIDLILLNNQLDKKLVTENTIFVYPATPAKLREHQELVIRAFHLGNADAKVTLNLLRTMLKTRDMFVDDRTNLLVIRDTPEAVRAAERLIAAQDMADPEVVLELEILEVSRTKVRDLGITYPSELAGPTGRLNQIGDLARANIDVDTGFKLKLLRNDGDTKTLANPRVRVRNREKAKVHVGDRIPVISSTIVGTSTSTGNSTVPVTTEQIQYIDVGIKVEAEPTIYPDDTVAVRINLDVSSLGAQTKTNAGTTAYEVGTRNASTVLRLRSGETQALMGLIRDDDIQTGNGLPFLGEAPGLDRVFGSRRTDRRSRELVLLITPQLVRGHRMPDSATTEFWSGTESSLRLRSPFAQTVASGGGAPSALPAPGGAVGSPAAAAAPPAAPVATPRPGGEAAPAAPGAALDSTGGGASASDALALSWRPVGQQKAGTEFTLDLLARSDAQLKGATLQLRYDPSVLEILGVEEGEFFNSGGNTVFTPRVDPATGVVFATITLTAAPVSGTNRLLSLRVKPRAVQAAGASPAGVTTAKVVIESALGVDVRSRRVAIRGETLEFGVAP